MVFLLHKFTPILSNACFDLSGPDVDSKLLSKFCVYDEFVGMLAYSVFIM